MLGTRDFSQLSSSFNVKGGYSLLQPSRILHTKSWQSEHGSAFFTKSCQGENFFKVFHTLYPPVFWEK